MANVVVLTGRLSRDPRINYSNDTCIASWTLAVDRRIKKDGQPTADFISCKAFGKTAEFIEKYFHKGMKMDCSGRLTTGKYEDKNGNTVYTTDVICDNVEFGESKNSQAEQPKTTPKSKQYDGGFNTVEEPVDDGGFEVVDDNSDDLPFN